MKEEMNEGRKKEGRRKEDEGYACVKERRSEGRD